ncbi:hypothetical protein HanIR_Chr07g0315881 [Helianthus annuus]|nr:hypothetical protein HanIR_Chr07g0315881 [Helianthus annuus]
MHLVPIVYLLCRGNHHQRSQSSIYKKEKQKDDTKKIKSKIQITILTTVTDRTYKLSSLSTTSSQRRHLQVFLFYFILFIYFFFFFVCFDSY